MTAEQPTEPSQPNQQTEPSQPSQQTSSVGPVGCMLPRRLAANRTTSGKPPSPRRSKACSTTSGAGLRPATGATGRRSVRRAFRSVGDPTYRCQRPLCADHQRCETPPPVCRHRSRPARSSHGCSAFAEATCRLRLPPAPSFRNSRRPTTGCDRPAAVAVRPDSWQMSTGSAVRQRLLPAAVCSPVVRILLGLPGRSVGGRSQACAATPGSSNRLRMVKSTEIA